MTDGALGVLTSARHDPLGYDIRAELFGSGDSVSVGLGPRTPMRSVEPGVPPPAGPAWPDFVGRFEDGLPRRARRVRAAWRAVRPRPPAPPATASQPCASRRPPPARSTSTDRCASRRSRRDTGRSDARPAADGCAERGESSKGGGRDRLAAPSHEGSQPCSGRSRRPRRSRHEHQEGRRRPRRPRARRGRLYVERLAGAGGSGASADRSNILIEVVTHGQASDPFWSIFKNGVDQGGKDMGVKVNYSAPADVRHDRRWASSSTPPSARSRRPRGLDPGRRRRSARTSRRRSRRDPRDLRELRLRRLREARHPDPRRPGRGDRRPAAGAAHEGRRREERALHQPGGRQRRPRRPLQRLRGRASARKSTVLQVDLKDPAGAQQKIAGRPPGRHDDRRRHGPRPDRRRRRP